MIHVVCHFLGSIYETPCHNHIRVTVMSGEDYYNYVHSFASYDPIIIVLLVMILLSYRYSLHNFSWLGLIFVI